MWGFIFFKEISNNVILLRNEINFKNSLEKNIIFNFKKHLITIDDNVVDNLQDVEYLIKNFYIKEIFDENTKIHIKLKLNLKEFLLISNDFHPTLNYFN